MEMTLPPHRPLCRRIRPNLGSFCQPSLSSRQFNRIRVALQTTASSDYSRRRLRKSSIPKTKVAAPKGFAPRPPVGTGNQRKHGTGLEEKNEPLTSEFGEDTQRAELSSDSSISNNDVKKGIEILDEGKELGHDIEDEKNVDEKYEKAVQKLSSAALDDNGTDGQKTEVVNGVDSLGFRTQSLTVVSSDRGTEEAKLTEIDGNSKDVNNVIVLETIANEEPIGEDALGFGLLDSSVVKREVPEKVMKDKVHAEVQRNKTVTGKQSFVTDIGKGTTEAALENVLNIRESNEVDEQERESDLKILSVTEKAHIDAQETSKMLEELAEKNLVSGNKVFVFPEVVKPDQVIQVFLNRSMSALVNENEFITKGEFNSWRWKPFTEKMYKTDLKGDWWSCQFYIPKEAYRIDFVFFNGGNVYENNDSKDFSIIVDGEMDESSFENFLLEEKQKELERLVAEQAEKERQAEEQQRREAERAAIEADKTQAKAEVDKKREALSRAMKLAKSVSDTWHIEPRIFKGGENVRIFYKPSSCPLAHAAEIWIHGGHNNWSDGLTIVERLFPSMEKDGGWWYADVVIPDHALTVDWVFADGPPRAAKVYDNDNFKDFHASVPMYVPEELFWAEEEHRIYLKLQEERISKEEALCKKAEKTALMKAGTRERTMKMFLLSQKHVVYTEPLDVRAGSAVTIFYNPLNTVLSGKPDVWFRCSFNRWTRSNGPLPPQKMVRAENGSHFRLNVKVPRDAYMMDFVFSEKEDGGIYDNKNAMDYHLPVSGGILKEPPMHIVHISVEMAPMAKVGGLGDVVTGLSRAVQDLGHKVDIILPKYDCMDLSNVEDLHFRQSFAWRGTEIKVWFGKVEGLSTYFLEPQNGMFWVGCIYGRNDGDRFGFFCHAALEFLLQTGCHPDILHCHDWTSAPVSWLFKEHYMDNGLSNSRVIFTIHNLEFGVQNIGKAMKYSDKATTVSQTYSKEVSGNPVISPYLYKFHGILNGIDPDIWDPYNDNFIPVSYTSENVIEGKRAAKEALQQRLGLKMSEQPLVGIITRLTVQKGIHLIKHAILQTLDRNGQVVLLGSAPDHRIQNDFVNFANQLHSSHGGRVRLCLTYDEPLSHLIYAGSDFILVPSLFEPCGLTQLTAMRYGSIPVVRKTGGLYDTVFDVDNDKERAQAQYLEPNGFSFDGADPAGIDYALNRALTAWYDSREWFNSLCKRVMEQDWSWNRPALDYVELYHAARK